MSGFSFVAVFFTVVVVVVNVNIFFAVLFINFQ